MTTRYELRATANGNYLDIFIQGAPTSAGCEARVPLRTGREHHCREFAEHIVNLLNASGQGLVDSGQPDSGQRLVDGGQQNPSSLTTRHYPLPTIPATNHSPLTTDPERWQQC